MCVEIVTLRSTFKLDLSEKKIFWMQPKCIFYVKSKQNIDTLLIEFKCINSIYK